MPIYEYTCRECSRTHELLQKLNDPPLRRCPICGSKAVVKRFSVPAIIVHDGPSASARPAPPALRKGGAFNIDASLPPDFRHPRIGARACVD